MFTATAAASDGTLSNAPTFTRNGVPYPFVSPCIGVSVSRVFTGRTPSIGVNPLPLVDPPPVVVPPPVDDPLAAPTVDSNAPDEEPMDTGVAVSAPLIARRTDAAETPPSRATSPTDGGSSMSATLPVLMPSVESLRGVTPSDGGTTGCAGVVSVPAFTSPRSIPRSASVISTEVTSPFPPATTIVISPDSSSAWMSSVDGGIGRFICTNVAASVDM